MTFNEYITQHKITMSAAQTNSNPNMTDDTMDHWRCVLSRREGNQRKKLTIIFSMGMGHKGKAPKASNLLISLVRDASGVNDATSFEDWCREYGYDPNSHKAEKIFKACEREAKKLQNFAGDSYEQLMSCEE